MAKLFDLRKQFKLLNKGLLKRLFADEPAMHAVAWESLAHHDTEPIVAAWETLADDRRRHFQVVLQDINEVADPRGLKLLMEDMEWRCPDLLPRLKA